MIITYKFSTLMNLISEALVPPYIAEHVFANKDKIADSLEKEGSYSFTTPTGETIKVGLDV